MEVKQNVCPESTIESAVQRNSPPKKVIPPVSISIDKSTSKGEKKLACESTIDSALRRNFIKRAAVVTAAAAIGGSFIGSNAVSKLIPNSSAKSSPDFCETYHCLKVTNELEVVCGPLYLGANAALLVGKPYCGDGRFVVTTCGKVGIQNPCPAETLCVQGTAKVTAPGSCTALYAISGSGTGVFGAAGGYGIWGCSGPGTGVNATSYCGNGVRAYAVSGVGIFATGEGLSQPAPPGHVGVWAAACSGIAVLGQSKAGIGVEAFAGGSGAIPLVAKGAACQSSPLQEWQNSSGCTLAAIAPSGRLCFGKSNGDKIYLVNGCYNKFGFGIGYSQLEIYHGSRYSCNHTSFGNSNGTTFTEFMRLTNQGDLGIGTTAPSAKLNAVSSGASCIPIIAQGASGQSANLQQWRNSSCTPLSVVNKCGWFGIGTCSPATTLQVKGSIGAKVATPSCSTYCVADNCFAVLVNATAAAKTVNLPKAIQGMILYIKNTGTDFAVDVKPQSGDTIEGATSKSVKKKDGVTLIAGGNSPATWYIFSSST